MPPHLSWTLPLLVALALGAAGAPPAAAPELRLEIRARALVPGEPLRVVLRSDQALESVEGTFLGRPLFFVPDPDEAGTPRSRFSAWAVVDLDRRPGTARLEATGATRGGAAIRGSLAVEIGRKKFPTQRLDVEPKDVTPPAAVEARIRSERARLAAVYSRRTAGLPAPGRFVAPVPGEPTSEFGARRIFNGKPRDPHSGLDLRAATGTEVRAAGRGVVALAGELYFSGGTVILDHGGGLFTVYAHLSRVDAAEGEALDAGSVLGLSGATGRVTGPHLHWGGKVGDRIFDPRALLDPRLFPGDGG